MTKFNVLLSEGKKWEGNSKGQREENVKERKSLEKITKEEDINESGMMNGYE